MSDIKFMVIGDIGAHVKTRGDGLTNKLKARTELGLVSMTPARTLMLTWLIGSNAMPSSKDGIDAPGA